MKFSHEKPPIFERCQKEFGVSWDTIILTYGDIIYSKHPIPDHLEVHEATHVDQQLAMGVDNWWELYFTDAKFRLSQELPAYKNQVAYIRARYNRAMRRKLEKHIYHSMAINYGDMVSEAEAEELLK